MWYECDLTMFDCLDWLWFTIVSKLSKLSKYRQSKWIIVNWVNCVYCCVRYFLIRFYERCYVLCISHQHMYDNHDTVYSTSYYTQHVNVRRVRVSSNIYCTCPQDITVKRNIHRSCLCKILIQQNRIVTTFCSSICTIDSGAVALHTVSLNSCLMSHLYKVCECNPL